jgi:hypothetical protein
LGAVNLQDKNVILLDVRLVNGSRIEAHFCETTCHDNS